MTNHNHIKSQVFTPQLIALALSSVALTFILFTMDEGYNDLRWMTKAGNWIPFVIYVGLFFSSQLVFAKILLKTQREPARTILSIIGGGFFLAVVLLIVAVFTTW